jgi:hypothetical protein
LRWHGSLKVERTEAKTLILAVTQEEQ